MRREDELAGALRALGERLEDEVQVDLSDQVVARLRVAAGDRREGQRLVALALAAALAMCGTAVAATPSLRESVWGWLSGSGVEIRAVDRLPATVPITRGADLGLGRRVEPGEAQERFGGSLPRVGLLGSPDHLFVAADDARGATLTLLWHTRAGLDTTVRASSVGALLTVRRADGPGDPWWIGKAVAPGSEIRFTELDVDGGIEAVWVEGAPHGVTRLDGRRETFRLAANVLVWRLDDRVYRLESALDQSAAERVAVSVAASP